MIPSGPLAFVWIGRRTPEANRAAIFHVADADLDLPEIPLPPPGAFDAARPRRAPRRAGIAAPRSPVPPDAPPPFAPDAARPGPGGRGGR